MTTAQNTNHQTTAGGNSANNKAVANKQASVPALDSALLEKDAGTGLSQVTTQDLSIPRLKVLMQLSPECNKAKPAYIEGAQPGMILNTVSQTLYDGDEGVLVVPAAFVPTYSEWSPMGSGSNAPEQTYPSNSDILSKTKRDPKTNKDMLPNGNYIQRDANHFVLILDDKNDTVQEALITFKSTGLKTSRKWLSLMTSAKIQGKNGPFTPPTFAFTYRLGTMQESNEKGTWVAWTVTKETQLEDANTYQQAKAFSEKITKGEISIVNEAASTNNQITGQDKKEEAPF
tara:strand:- start:616 stop:1476 length:861 start_codon:yes stop_codon:yes gene_type:complete